MRTSLVSAGVAIPVVPVGLRVTGRSVLVVGAGRIAARKAAVYVDQGALVTVVAPHHSDQMVETPVHERRIRPFVVSDLDDVWLVVTATGNPEVDGSVYVEAERRRIWCNAADDPTHCSVILPAVSRRGNVTVGVTTGGTSPAIASWLRRRIDALLDADTMVVADVASRVRTLAKAQGYSTEVDGWAEVLDTDALNLVSTNRTAELEHRLYEAVTGGRG